MIKGEQGEPTNENDIIYVIAKRAKELANLKMPDLRATNGYGCNGWNDCQNKDVGKTRGEIIEEILIEEFIEEFPRTIDENN